MGGAGAGRTASLSPGVAAWLLVVEIQSDGTIDSRTRSDFGATKTLLFVTVS